MSTVEATRGRHRLRSQRQSELATQETLSPDLPLVTIVILNYKRRECLARALDSVVRQEYANREIIIVDNHSEEDVRSLVAERDKGIRLIELPENLGTCVGRNAGLRVARGEFIVTIDNDVLLASPFEISKIVKAFWQRPDVQVLVFKICDSDTGDLRIREWCHPKYWRQFSQSEFQTHFLAEGASAYRREVFDVAGLYYEPLFIGHEGGDLALRILNHGFRILYFPSIRVFHLASPVTRSRERTYRLYTRNYIWLIYKNYPYLSGLRLLSIRLAMMFYFALREGCLRHFFKGICDGSAGLKRVRPDRTPMAKTTLRYLASLDKGRPNWWVRLARHWMQPQL
jgi:GT2 family glycosyltransferase